MSCAEGRPGPTGRLCPEVENAPTTAEGVAFWRVIRRAMPWMGGGMSPVRLDRAEVRGRLAGVPRWIVDELADDFEQAAIAALAEGRKRNNQGGEDG